MNTAHRWIMLAAAIVLSVLWIFPPFMVIDEASGGARHASLGHRPFWSPHASEAAADRLAHDFGPPASPGTGALRVGRNDVRLAMETVLVLAAAGLGGLATRRRRSVPGP